MSEFLLVDSSIYIEFQRSGLDPREKLSPWASRARLYQCGIIRAEYLRGLRRQSVRDAMEAFFDMTPEIPTDAQLWREVSDLAWLLDRAGKILPLTDVIIAVCALRVDATVISSNRHFQQIDGLRCRPDLPAHP